jgi:hypothetical protein
VVPISRSCLPTSDFIQPPLRVKSSQMPLSSHLDAAEKQGNL